MTPLALDIFIGLIIVLSAVVAYLRGVIKEVMTLVTLFLSIYLAYVAGHLLVPEFNNWLGVAEDGSFEKGDMVLGILTPPVAAKVFSYGGTFLVVFIVFTLLGSLLTRWVKEAGLGIIDRVLGGAFGLFRGFLLIFLLYIPFNYLIEEDKFPEWAQESISVPFFAKTFDWANEKFDLDEKIENKGSGVMIKFDKIDPAEIGKKKEQLKKDIKKAKQDLKDAINREEKDVQKQAPEDQPGELLNEVEKNLDPAQQPGELMERMKKGQSPETYPSAPSARPDMQGSDAQGEADSLNLDKSYNTNP